MVNWPFVTALFGISTIFAFLSLMTICSVNRAARDTDADVDVLQYDAASSISNTDGDALTSGLEGDLNPEEMDEDDVLQSPDSTTSD